MHECEELVLGVLLLVLGLLFSAKLVEGSLCDVGHVGHVGHAVLRVCCPVLLVATVFTPVFLQSPSLRLFSLPRYYFKTLLENASRMRLGGFENSANRPKISEEEVVKSPQ